MLAIGTRVERANAPTGNGRRGVIASEKISSVDTYLVAFDIGMPQYWSPRYFRVLEPPKPSWEA